MMSLILTPCLLSSSSPSPSHLHCLTLSPTLMPLFISFPPTLKLFPLQTPCKIPRSLHQPCLPPSNLISTARPHYPLSQTSQFLKPFILSQRRAILLGWLCSFASVFSLARIVSQVGKFSSVISTADAVQLRDGGSLLGALVLIRLVACYGQQACLWDAALKAVYELRVHVFKRVLERDLGYFQGKSGVSAGDIAYRITAEASDVADMIYSLLNTTIPSTLQLTAMVMKMLVISPILSVVSALVIAIVALVIAFLGGRLREISKKAHLSVAALSAYLNEIFPAIVFVKANNAELIESVRFQRLAQTDLSEHMKKRKMKAIIPQIVQAVYFGAFFIICIVLLMVSKGSIDGCSVVSFLTSLIFLVEPIQDVGKAYNELRQGEPAVERLCDLTRFKLKVAEGPDAADLDNVTGELKFCDISFKYGDDMPLVFNKLNLHIKAGETVALVGPSGGGKTTLVKLLLRLYDPLYGSILIDNHDIQSIQLESLRRHIGLVSQDIMLFSGTVAENIGYKDLVRKIDMERVKHAARIANADEFIRKLPEGYETNIGPRGSILSGGQKQRLAIARAVYPNPSILILDEATSSLDTRSSLLVRQAVEQLMENHTVLVIAHHLETVSMAKRVLLLNNGTLEELDRPSLLNGHNDSLLWNGLVI